MLWRTWIVLGLFSFAVGCEQTSSTAPSKKELPSSDAKQKSGPSRDDRPQETLTEDLEDRSLTTDQYVKLGFPKCDRPWSSADMSRAAKVLTEIAKRDPRELPRYESAKSGEVFARITSDENLDSIRKKSWPISVRTGFALQYLHAATSIGKLYGAAAIEQKAASDETTEILGLTLRIAVVLKDLSDEVLPTLDQNDPTYAVRVKGLKQMTAGLGPVLQGLMTQALTTKKLKPETRIRMLEYLDKTLPTLVKVLPTKAREDVRAKLKTLSERPEFAEHQQDFRPLLEKISQSLEEPTPNESDR
ncbi:MAG: hypothetical protein JWP89_6047 [Schlesneria sp.]|nr:hypothetical protein [Schlesneria sp.]